MKRTIFRIAIFAFLFGSLSYSTSFGELHAQSQLSNDIYAPPAGPFVSAQDAQIRLDGQITVIKQLMLTLVEGTPEYQTVYCRYLFHNEVLNYIIAGKTVSEAIVDGLQYMGKDEFNLQKNVMEQYRTQIINLLKA